VDAVVEHVGTDTFSRAWIALLEEGVCAGATSGPKINLDLGTSIPATSVLQFWMGGKRELAELLPSVRRRNLSGRDKVFPLKRLRIHCRMENRELLGRFPRI
jgi:hypothetical protein